VLLVGVVVAVLIGATVTAGSASVGPAAATPATGYQIPLVVGAVPYWDEQEARNTLETHSDELDVASPWSYAVAADGSVQLHQNNETEKDHAALGGRSTQVRRDRTGTAR
jgi:spore germination protein